MSLCGGLNPAGKQDDKNARRQESNMKKACVASTILASLMVLAASSGLAQQKQPSLQDLQAVVQREPDNPQAHYMLGLKYEIQGNSQQALQAYQKALSLKADYPEALYRLGELKAVQGDRQGAVTALTKAVKLKPDYREAKTTLGTVYGQQGAAYLQQGNWTAAAASLKEAVALNPKDDAAFNNLGTALAAQGDYDQAINAFQSAIQANPGNIDAHYNLGSAYLQTGNKQGVLGQYAVLGNLDPALAGQLFEQLSFPRGKSGYAKETPQHGQAGMRPSLPAEIAVSPPPLPDPLRYTPDLQGAPLDSKLPSGQMR